MARLLNEGLDRLVESYNINESVADLKTMPLADALVKFYSDYDYYDFVDSLNSDETGEDAIRKMEKDLADSKTAEAIAQELISMRADSDNEEWKEEIDILLDRLSNHLNEAKDLSTVEGSMTKVLSDKADELSTATTVKELYTTVKKILDDNNINTKASNRLLQNILKKKNMFDAYSVVYNSILAGSDNKTL